MLCFVRFCCVLFWFLLISAVPAFLTFFSAHKDSTRGQTTEWRRKETYSMHCICYNFMPCVCCSFWIPWGKVFLFSDFHIITSTLCLFLYLKCKRLFSLTGNFSVNSLSQYTSFAFLACFHHQISNHLIIIYGRL